MDLPITDIMRGVTTAAALDQAIEYSALDAYWDAFRRDSEDIGAITPAPKPDNITAPSCSGLTTAALDGERLGPPELDAGSINPP